MGMGCDFSPPEVGSMTRTRRTLALELESLDGRVLLSSLVHVAAHHHHAARHAVVARHAAVHQASGNAAATTALRGAFHNTGTSSSGAAAAQATPQTVAVP